MFTRPWSRLEQAASALSCLLNALAGGPRTCTFSAWSWDLVLRHSWPGYLRCFAVDALNWLWAAGWWLLPAWAFWGPDAFAVALAVRCLSYLIGAEAAPSWWHCRESWEAHVARGLITPGRPDLAGP